MSDTESKDQAAYTNAQEVSSSGDLEAGSENDAVQDPSQQETVSRRKSMYTQAGLVSYSTLQAYCNVLKDHVVQLGPRPKPKKTALPSSSIGASYWTHTEKEAFFDGLKYHGSTKLDAIASSIGSKSVLEVQQYLVALEEGLENVESKTSRRGPKFVQNPAAAEVSFDCESSLDIVAENLEQYLHQRVCLADKTRYGDDWLIDECSAQAIEEQLAKQAPATSEENGSDSNLLKESLRDTGDDLDNKQHCIQHPVYPSALLLKPLNFINLSLNVFMNGNVDEASRYDQLPVTTENSSGPSMLRSSFEVFHTLCVAYTKRLVHAAHFQAMTRLRADRDARRSTAVTTADVHKALNIMNIEIPDRQRYWAEATKRHALAVYSQSALLKGSGRRHLRHFGFKLEQEEVNKALMKTTEKSASRTSQPEQADEVSPSDTSDFVAESSSTSSHNDHCEAVDDADDDADEDLPHLATATAHPLDPDGTNLGSESDVLSSHQSEDARERYLESCDQAQSQSEDNLLRSLVGLSQVETDVPALPKPRGDLECVTHFKAWRSFDTYIADWEHLSDVPAKSQFDANEHGGSTSKRIRR